MDAKPTDPEAAGTEADKEERRRLLRQRVDEKLASSTITGLSQIFSADKLKYKLFWSILLIIGVIGFTVNLYEITERYYRAPLLTQLETERQPFTWPHFTFCNPSNPIPFWNSPELVQEWHALLNFSFKETDEKNLPKYGAPPNAKRLWPQYIATSSLDPQRFYKRGILGSVLKLQYHYLESSIASSSKSFDRYHAVSPEKIFRPVLYSIRAPMPCYTLDPEKIAKDQNLDIKRILSLKIYFLLDLYSYKLFDQGYEARKLYFYITKPNTTIEGNLLHFIFTGTDSRFQISESTHARIRDCTEKTFKATIYNFDMTSTQDFIGGYEDCRFALSQELFVKGCGCYNPHLPPYKFKDQPLRFCLNKTLYNRAEMTKNINCLNNLLTDKESHKKFEKELKNRCAVFKKDYCFTRTYTTIRNSNSWRKEMSKSREDLWIGSTQQLPNAVNKNITKNFGFKNLAILLLHRSQEPPVATFEEFEYPTSQYVSDFGGIAGLWLGLSLISLFEVLELGYTLFKYVRGRRAIGD